MYDNSVVVSTKRTIIICNGKLNLPHTTFEKADDHLCLHTIKLDHTGVNSPCKHVPIASTAGESYIEIVICIKMRYATVTLSRCGRHVVPPRWPPRCGQCCSHFGRLPRSATFQPRCRLVLVPLQLRWRHVVPRYVSVPSRSSHVVPRWRHAAISVQPRGVTFR
jgi:hypothetical protein